jgi:signal peptidase I
MIRALRLLRNNLPLVLLVLGVLSFRTGYADWSHIPSGSMEPTFFAGDYIWIDKTAFGPTVPFANVRLLSWGGPERGDIVTFVPPHTDELYIKRVIGLPGDQIFFDDRDLYVNGERLQTVYDGDRSGPALGTEHIGDRSYRLQLSGRGRMATLREPVTVPERHYFVLGDHRDNSSDSREWGFVDEDRIMGRVTHIAVSFAAERTGRERFAHRVR